MRSRLLKTAVAVGTILLTAIPSAKACHPFRCLRLNACNACYPHQLMGCRSYVSWCTATYGTACSGVPPSPATTAHSVIAKGLDIFAITGKPVPAETVVAYFSHSKAPLT